MARKKVTSKEQKQHNKTLILKTIYDQSPLSRADVSRATGLTRTTISDLVGELIEESYVEEIGYAKSQGGSPPMMLGVDPLSHVVIGIDMARFQFSGTVYNLRGKPITSYQIPVEDKKGEDAMALAFELIDSLLETVEHPVLGIGMGMPGFLNAKRGIVHYAIALDWTDMPLKKRLEEKYGLPVYVGNDCQVAGLGEIVFGHQTKVNSMVLVKTGRGVGGGIILDRKMYYGDTFGAGEIGHFSGFGGKKHCLCGNIGCLETVINDEAIIEYGNEVLNESNDGILAHLVEKDLEMNVESFAAAYKQGDLLVEEKVNVIMAALSRTISLLISAYGVQQIRIAGTVKLFGEVFIKKLNKLVDDSTLSYLMRDTTICYASLDDDIVMKGAAALVISEELGLV